MKIAVTGPQGRLGSELVSMGAIPVDADITNPAKLKEAVFSVCPDVLIHTAAYTNVDGAEEDPETAFRVNVRGTANVRDAFSGPMIHLSTDYVFDGKKGPYHEKARPTFLNWHGASKMASEAMVFRSDLIVRTTLLYGPHADKYPDFVQWALDKYKEGLPFTVEDNVRGTPTYVPHLAEALFQLAERLGSGKESLPHILHVAGKETVSRHVFATMIGSAFQLDVQNCYPSEKESSVRKAHRPVYGGLKTDLAVRCHVPIYSIEEGLKDLVRRNGLH